MLMARRGYRVLLVDRNTFPSDAISTQWIWPPGLSCLKRWGLLDRLLETGCPPWEECLVDLEDFQFTGRLPAVGGICQMAAPRRMLLDKLLVDAAVEAGVEMREAFTVTGLTSNNGRITGIRGHARGGAEVEESARIVIGADGKNSLVAQLVGAEKYNVKPVLTCWYYLYLAHVPAHMPGSHPREGCAIVNAPTHDGLVIVGGCFPRRDFEMIKSNPEQHIWKALDRVPDLAELCRQGKRVDKIMGSGDLPNFFRKPYGDGWALVGDSGYNKDPIGAQGISDAFVSVQMLVDAFDAVSFGSKSMQEAMAEYQKRRDEHFMPMYNLNAMHAHMERPSPETKALFQALRHDPVETARFLGTIGGTFPINEFYAPANIQRIVESNAAFNARPMPRVREIAARQT
jgi:flavin-dependent dehydrogenase